jgi:hypothetical protein
MCRLAGRHFFYSIAGPHPVNNTLLRAAFASKRLNYVAITDSKGKPVGS